MECVEWCCRKHNYGMTFGKSFGINKIETFYEYFKNNETVVSMYEEQNLVGEFVVCRLLKVKKDKIEEKNKNIKYIIKQKEKERL